MAIRKQPGDLRKEADGYAVTFERYFPYDTMTVWDAITNPEKLAVWFFPVTIDLRPGGKMVVQFPDGTPSNCWITQVEPGKVFAFIWENTEGPDEQAVWELFPEGDGCKLVFNYSRLADRYAINVPAGWHNMLDYLEEVLKGRREPYEDTQGNTPEEKALQAEYAGRWFREFAPFTLSSDYGTVHAVNGKYDIVFERLLRHPVAEVWEAITNAEKITLWSGGASAIDLRPGGKIRLGLLMATLEGIITGLENEKLLEYTLDAGNVIRWELNSMDNNQCRLVFTVRGNAAEDLHGAVPGWHGYLDFLAMVLDEGKVPAFPVDGWAEISKEITEKYKTILPVS